MSRTILITGGAGFIGSHLAAEATLRGDRVLVLDSLVTGKRENVPPGAGFLERDLAAPGLAAILRAERVDVVSHHAAQANVRVSANHPAADAEANILGSLALIQACREAGVRKFLFASSGGTVYGEQQRFPCDEEHPARPCSPYGCAKLAVELYLRAFEGGGELEPVILRYANVYGPRQDPQGEAGIVAILAEKFLAGARPRIFGDGSQTRDYVFVGDIAAAHRAVLERWRPGTYNVGTGIETSVAELSREIARRLGRSTSPEHVAANAVEIARSSLSSAKLERVFGFRPRVAIAEGLDLTLPFYAAKLAAA